MRFFLVLLFMLLSQAAIGAETLRLRTGQHKGFVRVAIDLPATMYWQIEQTDFETKLSFPDHPVSYKLDTAFERISRNLITGLDQVDGELVVTTSCKCIVKARLEQAQMLVLDFLEQERPVERITAPQPFPKTELMADTPAPLPFTNNENSAAVAASQSALLQELSRSHSLGLIELTQSRSTTLEPATRQHDLSADFDMPIGESQINLRNSVNDAVAGKQAVKNFGKHENCSDFAFLDPQKWGIGQSFIDGLALARDRFQEDSGHIDPAKNLRSARHYLRYGLVQEAKFILEQHSTENAAEVLLDVVLLLENQQVLENRPLHNFKDCEGPGSLFVFLASRDETLPRATKASELLMTFLQFPQELKVILSKSVRQRFIEIGRNDLAQAANRMNERVFPKEQDANERPERQVLDVFVSSSSAQSGRNILEEFNNSLSQTSFTSDENTQQQSPKLLESYEFELRETGSSRTMQEAVILANARGGNFDEAFDAYQRYAQRNGVLSSLKDLIESELIKTDDDLIFLKHVSRQAELGHTFGPEALQPIVSRLSLLGFEDLSDRVLANGPMLGASGERRLARAENYLSKGEMDRAYSEILGLSDSHAEALRQQIIKSKEPTASHSVEPEMAIDDLQSIISLRNGRLQLDESQSLRTSITSELESLEITQQE